MSGITIPGLTIDSQGSTPLQPGSSIQFGSGNPLPVADASKGFSLGGFYGGQQWDGSKLLPQGQYLSGWGNTGSNNTLSTTNNNNPNGQIDLAKQQNDALLSQLNTSYDKNLAYENNQLNSLTGQRQNSLDSLNTQLSQAQDTVKQQKDASQTATDNGINSAGSVAHQTQQQTRNILRAMGIEGGTYAGEALAKPLNAYDQQRANLVQQNIQHFNALDDFYNQTLQQHQNAVNQLETQYQSLVSNIQTDQRFNERDRANAINQANVALNQNIAAIQAQAQAYAQAVQNQQQSIATATKTILNIPLPAGDNSKITGSAPAYAQPGAQQAPIFDQRKLSQTQNPNDPFSLNGVNINTGSLGSS